MAIPCTTPEPPRPHETPGAHALTYVMTYDNVTIDRSLTIHIDKHQRVRFGRGDVEQCTLTNEGSILVSDEYMSATHAVLQIDGSKATLEDCKSTNKTFVNGIVLEPRTPRPLIDGDLIEVGHSLFCYRYLPERLVNVLRTPPARPNALPTRTLNPEMLLILHDLQKIAPSQLSVLILGERGSGKESLARTIHEWSKRPPKRFAATNCGGVPPELMASHLFGHLKGAFTHATEERNGVLHDAHEGTCFLDEIGRLPPADQPLLLRVLQQKEYAKVGPSAPTIKINIRWVSATNSNIENDPQFQQDLLDRLAGHIVRIPPLRRRCEDFGILTAHILKKFDRKVLKLSQDAVHYLFMNGCSGNIRVLESKLEAAVTKLDERADSIDIEDLGGIRSPPPASNPPAPSEPLTPEEEEDKKKLVAALEQNRWDIAKTSRKLGYDYPRKLARRMAKLGITRSRKNSG